MKDKELKEFLDAQVEKFNHVSFIEKDPISIPHQFSKLQDIEIIGFWTAMLSWGQRVTIINKSNELIQLMDGAPYDFMINHEEKDREPFLAFKHRTFQAIDTLYFLEFFQNYYRQNNSLETAMISDTTSDVRSNLIAFHDHFFDSELAPQRTRKHVSTPVRKSTCKRLNMFLRWMVRKDHQGVDFGLWDSYSPSRLMIPFDVHVERIARKLGILDRKQRDWKAVEELTSKLSILDPSDPVKYDFALFGLGVLQWDRD